MASEANDRLCDAAERDDVAGIAAALLVGADPNAFEGTGYTPLLWAATYGHAAVIAALLAAGARVDATGNVGITPLMEAALYGHIAAIDALLAAGADVHRVDNDGGTVLHFALVRGRLDATRVLLDAGARTGVRDRSGKRPIDVVRVLTLSLARCHRTCNSELQRRAAALSVRRCARGQATSPAHAPSVHCSPLPRPGPAAGPSPSHATGTCGSGRRKRG
jgi:hypothetical protein